MNEYPANIAAGRAVALVAEAAPAGAGRLVRQSAGGGAAGHGARLPLRGLVVALATTLLGACSMIPVFERPAAPVPASFPQAQPTEASAVAPLADTIAWRDYFADERLRNVIALALDNNRDLRVAALNIERARAQYGIQRADLFPSIAVSGGQNAQRVPGDLSASQQAAQRQTGAARSQPARGLLRRPTDPSESGLGHERPCPSDGDVCTVFTHFNVPPGRSAPRPRPWACPGKCA